MLAAAVLVLVVLLLVLVALDHQLKDHLTPYTNLALAQVQALDIVSYSLLVLGAVVVELGAVLACPHLTVSVAEVVVVAAAEVVVVAAAGGAVAARLFFYKFLA